MPFSWLLPADCPLSHLRSHGPSLSPCHWLVFWGISGPVPRATSDLLTSLQMAVKPITTTLAKFFIPRQSRRDIVLASSVRPSVLPSVHSVCPSGTISQYLLVRFDSFLVQMINTMDSQYPISLVKIDPLTLELLPLF